MTTVNCPKCEELVRMPANASAQALVQCPLCVEEFELSMALDRLAPMLVVLSDPEAADTLTELDGDVAAPNFSFDEPASEPASDPAFAFEDGSAEKSGSVAARRARSQRHQKSAVKEMIKVVVGGVIGLSIGQLILWWLPGDLKRDPIDLGPKIPSFAAFLVHPDFRADAIAKKNGAEPDQENTADSRSKRFELNNAGNSKLPESTFGGLIDTNPDPGGSTKKNTDGVNGFAEEGLSGELTAPDGGSADSHTTGTDENDLDTAFDGDVPQINLRAFPSAPETTPKDPTPSDNGNTIPTISPPTADPTTVPAPTSTSPQTVTGDFKGVRNAPTISIHQLSSRLAGAVSASVALNTSSGDSAPNRSLAKDFYMTMAELGEAITFVDQVSASDKVNEVGKFALEVGQQAIQLDLIGTVAPSWIKSTRPHNGLVVVGVVESIDFTAPYYVTTLVLSNKSVHKIVSINDPSGDYQPQDTILILGSILDAPRQNLENYQGAATTVILDGLHAMVPNTE